MACSICICSRGYDEKMRSRGGGSRPRRKEGQTWGRRRRAGEALPGTLATGVWLRAGGRGQEMRIWPEGREARSMGSSGLCCAAPELAGSGRRWWWRRRGLRARGRGGELVLRLLGPRVEYHKLRGLFCKNEMFCHISHLKKDCGLNTQNYRGLFKKMPATYNQKQSLVY